MPLGCQCLSNCWGQVKEKIKVTELGYVICQASLPEFANVEFVTRKKKGIIVSYSCVGMYKFK